MISFSGRQRGHAPKASRSLQNGVAEHEKTRKSKSTKAGTLDENKLIWQTGGSDRGSLSETQGGKPHAKRTGKNTRNMF